MIPGRNGTALHELRMIETIFGGTFNPLVLGSNPRGVTNGNPHQFKEIELTWPSSRVAQMVCLTPETTPKRYERRFLHALRHVPSVSQVPRLQGHAHTS